MVQRQRVGVARALAAEPKLLLMDEPFGALDPLTRAEMQDMLQALLKRLNKTVLLVTHDLDEALFLASHIVLMEAAGSLPIYRQTSFSNRKYRPCRITSGCAPRIRLRNTDQKAANGMTGFLAQHASEIAELTLEHLWLTGNAMLLAGAIGGTHRHLAHPPSALGETCAGVVNIIQTIPSLASLDFCCPFPGSASVPRALPLLPLTRLRSAAHRAQYLRRHRRRRPQRCSKWPRP